MQPRSASASTRPGVSPVPRINQVNTQTKILDTTHGRILCIADIRGRLSALNDLARDANAKAIIHTGDFGFFEDNSLERINDRTLRHLTMYSPLIPSAQRSHLLAPENPPAVIRSTVTVSLISEFPLLLSGQIKLQVPVYTVWGACEDVVVLEKFRAGTYSIDNLHALDEATTRCLDVGGVKLRLLGLGGALVPHKLFDNGEGHATIAGGQGTMWTTALQIGELVDTAQRVFDPSETRLLVTHASPGREGIMAQLALVLKADLTLSAGLHFRYATSYNEFSIQSDFEGFRHKLMVGKEAFDKVWDSVKSQVNAVIDDNQRVLLDKALSVVERIPPQTAAAATTEEPAWKNCWNWNLCDAAYGSLVFDIRDGRVSGELKSQGFNYAYRRSAATGTPGSVSSPLPNASIPPVKGSTPAPSAERPAPPHLANDTNSSNPLPTTEPPQAAALPGATTPGSNAAQGAKQNSDAPPLSKAEKNKAKQKEKKERKAAERAAEREKDGVPSTAPASSGKATPIDNGADAAADRNVTDVAEELKSPVTEGSSGLKTPTSRGSKRNPWTLWMRLQEPMKEEEVKEYYGETSAGIIRINYPNNHAGKQLRSIYVEFGDEEAMRLAMDKRPEKYKDTTPEVIQATDRESRVDGFNSSRGGRGRGRGGFAARGLHAAGLTSKRDSSDGSTAVNKGGE